ncbi:MAG TPA: hypothetical protein VK501_20060 [Baekduia sp.]|uniref:hypothetical protein n=1 Tax=Baekduia sp. TaxID=2600305 RepID=UPI002BEE7E61|nr:hypothetical protein [Baekduia sp.]HMJ36206.1 hypothetical protein [Baekduia sp.]
MPLAHIAGVPVEETVLSFAPLGVAGVGALAAYVTGRIGAWRHPRAPRGSGRRR